MTTCEVYINRKKSCKLVSGTLNLRISQTSSRKQALIDLRTEYFQVLFLSRRRQQCQTFSLVHSGPQSLYNLYLRCRSSHRVR